MPESSKKDKKVLIVEDEYVVARNLKMIVEKLGFGVLGIASTGDSALKLIDESGAPALVLMDITLLGGMDGIETARVIQDRCGAPVLYITGNKDKGTIERAIHDTIAFGLVNKPFNVGTLKNLITDALDPGGAFPDAPRKKESRESERLTIPTGDDLTVRIRDRKHEHTATVKNLSMNGAAIVMKDLIMGIQDIEVSIIPKEGGQEVSSIAQVRHMAMVNRNYLYGIEFQLDSENRKALASYYSYLLEKWNTGK
jgi:CheY-like chemotaxis protein